MDFSNLFNNLFLISSISHILSWTLHAILSHQWPKFPSVPAMVVNEVLPVVQYEELILHRGHLAWGGCTVCLCKFKGEEEVRRLTNCRHVFHRGCLDNWMWNKQHGCPLCRSLLVPNEMYGAFQGEFMWASAGIPDSYIYEATWAPYAHIAARAKDC